MGQGKPESASSTADRELVAVRVFDAPRETVYRMWTDPEHLGRWWGPRGFTTTTHSMEMKPGGVWRLVMHGPDGRDYQNKITYVEIDRCATDAIAVVTGCRLGKRALKFVDFGKVAARVERSVARLLRDVRPSGEPNRPVARIQR